MSVSFLSPENEVFSIKYLLRLIFAQFTDDTELPTVHRVCKTWRAQINWFNPTARFIEAAGHIALGASTHGRMPQRAGPHAQHARCLWAFSGEFMTLTSKLAVSAAMSGCWQTVEHVLIERKWKKGMQRDALFGAVYASCVTTVKVLLKYIDIDIPLECWTNAEADVLRVLLTSADATKMHRYYRCMNNICAVTGRADAAKIFLQHLPRAANAVSERTLVTVATSGDIETLDLLLTCTPVDPSYMNNELLHYACINNRYAQFERLLHDRRICASRDSSEILMTAVLANRVQCVEHLLSESSPGIRRFIDIQPDAQENHAIFYAAAFGHLAIVRRLLREQSVRERLRTIGAYGGAADVVSEHERVMSPEDWARRAADVQNPNSEKGMSAAIERKYTVRVHNAVVDLFVHNRRVWRHKRIFATHDRRHATQHSYVAKDSARDDDNVDHNAASQFLTLVTDEYTKTAEEDTFALPDILCAAVMSNNVALVEYLLSAECADVIGYGTTLESAKFFSCCMVIATNFLGDRVADDAVLLALVSDRRCVVDDNTVSRWIADRRMELLKRLINNRSVVLGRRIVIDILVAACKGSADSLVAAILTTQLQDVDKLVVHHQTLFAALRADNDAVTRRFVTHPSFRLNDHDMGDNATVNDIVLTVALGARRALDIINLLMRQTTDYSSAFCNGHSFYCAIDKYDDEFVLSFYKHIQSRGIRLGVNNQHTALILGHVCGRGLLATLRTLREDIPEQFTQSMMVVLIRNAIVHHQAPVLRFLLEDERFCAPDAQDALMLFYEAALRCHEPVYALVKADARIFTPHTAVQFVHAAREYNAPTIVDVLRGDKHLLETTEVLRFALALIERGMVHDLASLLDIEEFDPSIWDNALLVVACEHNNQEIAALLLRDPRVDIFTRNNYLLDRSRASLATGIRTFIDSVVKQREWLTALSAHTSPPPLDTSNSLHDEAETHNSTDVASDRPNKRRRV